MTAADWADYQTANYSPSIDCSRKFQKSLVKTPSAKANKLPRFICKLSLGFNFVIHFEEELSFQLADSFHFQFVKKITFSSLDDSEQHR